MSLISGELIQNVTGAAPPKDLKVDDIGLLDYVGPGRLLSFIDSLDYLDLAKKNDHLHAVFTTLTIANALKQSNVKVISLIVDDPRWCFYSLHNEIARVREKLTIPSVIHTTAKVSSDAFVDAKDVNIGARTIVEPGAVIMRHTTIGEDCVIHAGAIIGASGFEFKRTSKGILPVAHDRKVKIGNEVEVGGGSHIARGWGNRDTMIGDQTKLDALVHIAHNVTVGKRCLIAANVVVCGSVTIGDDVWIGPSTTISHGVRVGSKAFITLGSCVVKNVLEDQRVTGYFALPHEEFLMIMYNNLRKKE